MIGLGVFDSTFRTKCTGALVFDYDVILST
jgi:hypothetical protein